MFKMNLLRKLIISYLLGLFDHNNQKKNTYSLENQDSQMVYLENQVQQLEMNRVDVQNDDYRQKLQEQMIQAKNDEISLKQGYD